MNSNTLIDDFLERNLGTRVLEERTKAFENSNLDVKLPEGARCKPMQYGGKILILIERGAEHMYCLCNRAKKIG